MTKKLRDNRGLTLLEVLVAVFVLAIVALPLLNLFVVNTVFVRRADDLGDTTYLAQAVEEDLQKLGYSKLYSLAPLPGATGSYQLRSVADSSVLAARTIRIDRLPSGSFNNLVSGAVCYAHLIVRGASSTFTTPDGRLYALGAAPSSVNVTATQFTAGGTSASLNRPAGAKLILIINAGTAAIASMSVSLPATDAYVLYALSPDDGTVQNITITGGNAHSKQYRKFNSKTDASADPPPGYMLVNAVCRVFRQDGSVESLVQNTLKVSLP